MSKEVKQPYTTIAEMEAYIIKKALDKAYNKIEAAKLLGITPRTLYTKIHTYKLY